MKVLKVGMCLFERKVMGELMERMKDDRGVNNLVGGDRVVFVGGEVEVKGGMGGEGVGVGEGWEGVYWL